MKSRTIKIQKTTALIAVSLTTAVLQTLFIVNDQMLLMLKPFEGMALIALSMLPFLASILSSRFLEHDEKHSIMIRNTIILYAIIMTYFIFRVVTP